VKKEALRVSGTLYKQIGPRFKILIMSLVKTQDTKSCLEKCFDDIVYDAEALSAWRKQPLASIAGSSTESTGQPSLDLDIPKTDIFSRLSPDIMSRMVSNDAVFLCCIVVLSN